MTSARCCGRCQERRLGGVSPSRAGTGRMRPRRSVSMLSFIEGLAVSLSCSADRKPVRSLRRRRGYALCGLVGPFPAAADTVSAGVDDDLPAVLDAVVGREPDAADQP